MNRLKTVFGALMIAVLCMGMSVAAFAGTRNYIGSVSITGTGEIENFENHWFAVVNGSEVKINTLGNIWDAGEGEYSVLYYLDSSTKVTVNGKAASYKRTETLAGSEGNGPTDYYYFTVGGSSDSSKKADDDDEDHEPPSWVKNPNQKPALVMSAPALGGGYTLGWQEQGELGKLAFSMARPAGWSEAFSFNILKNGQPDTTLKSGVLTMNIPSQYIRTGRRFAVLAIEPDGTVKVYPDTDTSDLTLTIALSGSAYACDLIYIG